jgi:hypothetical protein
MTSQTLATRSTTFKIGWWILFVVSVVSVLAYVALTYLWPNLADALIADATFSLYCVFVLLIPYRRVEKWAWYLTWVLVIPAVVLSFNNLDAAPGFLTGAGLVTLGQLLTRPAFFQGELHTD